MTITLGSKVRLKACHDSGQPGTVIRESRGRLTVYWADLDFWSRHHPESLELAEAQLEKTEVRRESWRQGTDARRA